MPKTYTAAGSATAGQVYTATAHNTIVTNVNNFIVPPSVKVTANAQSVTAGVDTQLQFNGTKDWDTDSMHSSGSNTRITFNTAGIYTISARVNFVNNATGFRYIAWRIDGTTAIGAVDLLTNTTLDPFTVTLSEQFSFTASQYLELRVYHTGSTSLNVNAAIAATWIGRTS